MVVIDIAKNQIINTIAFSSPPNDLAINTVGTKGYAIYANKLAEIDLLMDSIQNEISLPYESSQIAITADNTKAYISHYNDNFVSVIDLNSLSIIHSISISTPYAMAMNPIGNFLYICSDDAVGYCLRIDTDKIANTFNAGTTPYDIAVNPQGTKAYVTNFINGTLRIIDLQNPGIPLTILQVGTLPTSFAVSPDGTMGFVTDAASNTITSIDLITPSIMDSISVPHLHRWP